MSSITLPDLILSTPAPGQPLASFNADRSSTSALNSSSTQSSSANGESDTKSGSGPNVGAIVGGVLGGVIALALILLLIRWRYIRQRQSSTHAQTVRARMAQCKVQISGPTNFSHLESGTLASDTSSIGKLTIQTHNLQNNTTSAMTVQNGGSVDSGSIAGSSESPVEMMKTLDSGLGSQLHTMRNQRKPVPNLDSRA